MVPRSGEARYKGLFEPIRIEDSRLIALLQRAILVFIAAHVIIFAISGYRAYFQVRRLELTATERVVRSASAIHSAVVSYARGPVDVQIELIQGEHSETLAKLSTRPNEWSLYDPRTQSAEVTVMLTPELLASFQAGAALVRATAVGRPQWTRLPPPVVRELAVEIQSER